jgi:uncharacterized Rmd1/YagE family protein
MTVKMTESIFQMVSLVPLWQVLAYKLSASFALAQSIQIDQFEQAVADLVEMNQSVTEDMALRGKVMLSKKEITKREC